jgi:hypothetical protein
VQASAEWVPVNLLELQHLRFTEVVPERATVLPSVAAAMQAQAPGAVAILLSHHGDLAWLHPVQVRLRLWRLTGHQMLFFTASRNFMHHCATSSVDMLSVNSGVILCKPERLCLQQRTSAMARRSSCAGCWTLPARTGMQ